MLFPLLTHFATSKNVLFSKTLFLFLFVMMRNEILS